MIAAHLSNNKLHEKAAISSSISRHHYCYRYMINFPHLSLTLSFFIAQAYARAHPLSNFFIIPLICEHHSYSIINESSLFYSFNVDVTWQMNKQELFNKNDDDFHNWLANWNLLFPLRPIHSKACVRVSFKWEWVTCIDKYGDRER